MSKKTTWVAYVKTEACDKYTFKFKTKPTRVEVCAEVRSREGDCADLDFYLETCDVEIYEWDKRP